MDSFFEGKHAVVTGGASGIGLAAARALADAGARVTVADRDDDGAHRVAEQIGGEAWVVDFSDTEALERELAERPSDVDILVNNAGVQRMNPVHEYEAEDWRLLHRIMLEAPFLLSKWVLPGMYERGFGRLVHMSSVHGLQASPYKSAYVAAKHGLEGLSKTIALEAGERGVTSNCIGPAFVETPLVRGQVRDQARLNSMREEDVVSQIMLAEASIKRLVQPEEVASLVMWLAGKDAGMVTGSSFPMDGGWGAR